MLCPAFLDFEREAEVRPGRAACGRTCSDGRHEVSKHETVYGVLQRIQHLMNYLQSGRASYELLQMRLYAKSEFS